jgi:hypothetical protein
LRRLQHSSDAEVSELDDAISCHENILRFQIPMQDMLGVHMAERGKELGKYAQHLFLRESVLRFCSRL